MERRNSKTKVAEMLFVIITILLLIYRVTLHADIYDEIINIGISYRIAHGDVPFYNCWEAFQSGDIFLAPFIWLYLKIFKTTSGLVLFSRLLYLAILFLLVGATYLLFSKYLEKKQAFFVSYVVLFFELYSLFYLWYDTISVILLLLGDILIIRSMESGKTWIKRWMLALAGIVHCAMVFAYPSFILVALVMAIIIMILDYKNYRNSMIRAVASVFFYALGALVDIICLILYFHFSSGLRNVFDVLSIITGTRGANGVSILDIFRDIVVAYVSVNKFLIPVTIVCLILYFISLKNEKMLTVYLATIVVLPAFNQIFIEKNSLMGLANYLSYIAFWCPFLFYVVKEKSKFDLALLWVFYVPSVVSLFAISLTTVYADIGPVKCWQACLPAALATLYFFCKIWRQGAKRKQQWSIVIMAFVSVVLLVNSYSYIYLNQPYIKKSDKRITDGLYWGIKVNSNMEIMPELQWWLKTVTEDCESITIGARLRPAYLMTDLQPMTWSIESPWYRKDGKVCWDMEIKYYEYFDEYPDAICVESDEIENTEIQEILEDKYSLRENRMIGDYDIYLYVLKDKMQ